MWFLALPYCLCASRASLRYKSREKEEESKRFSDIGTIRVIVMFGNMYAVLVD
jgi:hypothetical protein